MIENIEPALKTHLITFMSSLFLNLHQIEEKRHQEESEHLQESVPGSVGVPGLCPSKKREPPENLQQVIQFQRNQVEEKKVNRFSLKNTVWKVVIC